MFNEHNLRVLQMCAFIMVTLIALVIGYSFPNLPPFVRALLPKGIKGIVQLSISEKLDPRFLEWFNRDPDRNIPTEPSIIVSPADGVVWQIKHNPKMKHILIEMRYTDVHVQRIPIDGQVICIEGEGKKLENNVLVKDYMLNKMMPFQKVTTLKTEIGIVRVRQITSFFAKRIQVYVKKGQKVKRGQRLGRVLAGSTIVLEVPKKVSILVKQNQEVVGGETIIAKYQ
ncbi:hypothetical protein AMJ44_02195 [candidate division WOR-1 bacterium DG_54_3]|uniref:Phosphatidylserine decarboxylase n=1 Tax=candidate division WOR-1 bacterium DG_54_3 TaxID=1703775 RepID=A0A0S7Y4Z0_UNCSA|nr:MAG: hypothetical protein AMJ44_02195 [candidate division WOR-1 bacterium DG_54_3]